MTSQDDLLAQALIFAEEIREVYLNEKARADELQLAKDALEATALDLERNLDALRQTDRERRRLLSALVTAQEQERQRIAGDIHDDSIQVMAAVGIRLALLRRKVADEEALRVIERLDQAIEESIRRLRSLLFVLRPISLEREGLVTALRDYIAMNSVDDGPEYEVIHQLESHPPEDLSVVVFRIAQEALNNIRKHAKARNVQVIIETKDDGVLTVVRDDGQGFSLAEPSPGHLGLLSSRERAEQCGGWFEVDSSPGAGTTVRFWLPLMPAADD